MNKSINRNKGFLRSSLFLTMVVVITALVMVSCSGGEDKNVADNIPDNSAITSESSDSPNMASGLIAQTTCLDCHPKMKDGGFNIDFEKVKEAGMVIDKGQDVKKEDKKETTK